MNAQTPPATPALARPRREEGVVLLLILILITTTIGAVYAFARISVLGISSARQRMDRTRAELLARSSLDIALQALRDDAASPDPLHSALDYPEDAWAILNREPLQFEGGVDVRFRIRDAGQRIDLNAMLDGQGATQPPAARFLRDALDLVIENMPGRKEEKLYKTEELTDAILDWLDADETTRVGDEEAKFYREKGSKRGPVNRPLLTLAELEDVPGMDLRLLQALDSYFAPSIEFPRSGGGTGLNPNTAPPYMLAMIYLLASQTDTRFVKEDDVFRTVKARRDGQLFCPSQGSASAERCTDFASTIGRGEQIFPPLTFRSDVFSVEVEARTGNARACVFAVLSRGGNGAQANANAAADPNAPNPDGQRPNGQKPDGQANPRQNANPDSDPPPTDAAQGGDPNAGGGLLSYRLGC